MVNRLCIAWFASVLCLGGCTGSVRPAADAAPAPVTNNLDQLLERSDYVRTLAAGTPIRIDNPFGDVRLRFGGYEHALEIHATMQRPDRSQPGFLLEPQLDGSALVFSPQLPAGTLLPAGQRVDLTVFVPKAHPVTVRTRLGLIESRGLQSDLTLFSESGSISARGTAGLLQAHSEGGQIEIAFENAPAGSSQHLSTTTGTIIVAFSDSNNLALDVATSAAIATEYSLAIERLPGAEPNKRARAEVGTPAASLKIDSKRGEIRLLRRAGFTPVASTIEPARGSKEEG